MKQCFALVLLLLAGCTSGALPPVNARLDSDRLIYFSPPDSAGDVTLLAECKSCDKIKTEKRGDWNYSTFLVTFNVLKIERGDWPHPTLQFLAHDQSPTIESGIMLQKEPWPYRPGAKMRFELDTTPSPAKIVAQHGEQ